MPCKVAYAFLLIIFSNWDFASAILANKSDEYLDLVLTHGNPDEEFVANPNKCTVRLHSSLEKLRKRQSQLRSSALIDLSGYALHQTLRNAPLDMYVTDIKVRAPGVGDWMRVQKCQFSNRDNRVTTQILFNDLSVSGNVKLFDENVILKNPHRPEPSEFCSMTLRLRRAGLGINAFPTRARSKGIEVRTEAKFMDPNFLSVHAYGCKLNQLLKTNENEKSEEEAAQDRYHEVTLRNGRHISNFTDEPHQNLARNMESESPEVRIITLGQTPQIDDEVIDLHDENEAPINDFHRDRILNTKSQKMSEKDKLKAVLHVKNIIAQQANHVFQAHGPFSQGGGGSGGKNPISKPLFVPHNGEAHKVKPKPVSTITELDENLAPIRPVPHKPFEALFNNNGDKIVNYGPPQHHSKVEDLSREMEDIFLRGTKTLLTKYLEKQLEVPLKEALMVNIGYTVSYG